MSTPPTPSYSESFDSLEDILDQFKGGTLTLEESLSLFEAGIGHLKNCQTQLSQGKGRVEELVQSLQAGGEVVTRPFDSGD